MSRYLWPVRIYSRVQELPWDKLMLALSVSSLVDQLQRFGACCNMCSVRPGCLDFGSTHQPLALLPRIGWLLNLCFHVTPCLKRENDGSTLPVGTVHSLAPASVDGGGSLAGKCDPTTPPHLALVFKPRGHFTFLLRYLGRSRIHGAHRRSPPLSNLATNRSP
jgi:hypothetical protein